MSEQKEDTISMIKKLFETQKVVIGTQRTVKGLKSGKIKKVYLAKNTSKQTKEDLEHYAKLSGAQIIQLDMPNDELRVICKKPFNISVLGQI